MVACNTGIGISAWATGMLNPQVQPANGAATTNTSAGIPAIDDTLGAGGYPTAGGICAEWGHQVPCNNHYAITRASTKYINASDGIYNTSVSSNVLALGSATAALIEEACNNDALWSRDMINAAWIKTNDG